MNQTSLLIDRIAAASRARLAKATDAFRVAVIDVCESQVEFAFSNVDGIDMAKRYLTESRLSLYVAADELTAARS